MLKSAFPGRFPNDWWLMVGEDFMHSIILIALSTMELSPMAAVAADAMDELAGKNTDTEDWRDWRVFAAESLAEREE